MITGMILMYYVVGLLVIAPAVRNPATRESFAKRHDNPLRFWSVAKLLWLEPLRWPRTLYELSSNHSAQ